MESIGAVVQALLIAACIAVVGLLVRINARVAMLVSTIDRPDTGIAARLTLMAQRIHDNANVTNVQKYQIEDLDRRVTRLEEHRADGGKV